MVTRNVVLTETQDQLVQALVASGRYQNVSERRKRSAQDDVRLGIAGAAANARGLDLEPAEERVEHPRPIIMNSPDPVAVRTDPAVECAPWDGQDHAAVLTGMRALRSSNWAGSPALRQAIAVAVYFQDADMMGQPIQ